MSISAAIKIGGSVVISGGALPASYLAYDNFFSLYKVESDVLQDNVYLSVVAHTPNPADNDSKNIYLKIHKDSKWECIVKAVATENSPVATNSQSDLITLLESKLPKNNDSSNESEKLEKLKNKKNLVKNCSRNRKLEVEQSDEKVVSEITMSLKKEPETGSNIKWTFEDKQIGQLFGRGFWI